MTKDDVKALAERERAKARRIAESGRVARHAAPAAPAGPAPVPPEKPALRLVEGGKAGQAGPGQKNAPAPSSGRKVRVSDETVARARARGRPPIDPALDRAFSAYKPPPGVLPPNRKVAQDSALPGVAWANGAYLEGAWFEGMQFPGYAYLAQLMQRTEYRRAAERLATEMTRKWIRITSKGDDDKTEKIAQLETRLKELKMKEAFAHLAVLDNGFGRAHLYIDTGDTDDPKELRTPIGNGRNKITQRKIGKGSIRRISVVEPVWCYPAKYNADDPLRPDWYMPETWFCMGKEIHRSRLLPFVGRDVPDLLKPSYAFGGLSLTQMLKPYVDNWLDVRQSVARLVQKFSTSGIKTDLQQMLAPNPGESSDDLFKRIDLFVTMAKNEGLMVLNQGAEEFFQFNVPLGTLDALQAQSQEQMCSATGIPVVVLLGLTPHGLNASSDGEIRAFEDWIMAYQPHFYGDNVQRVIDFAMVDLWGEVDPEIGYEWIPLHSLDEKGQADVQKAKSDIDNGYVDRGVLDPLEVRRRLAADVNSGYNGIDVEDVPEPPDQGEGEGGEGGDDPFGGGAENDNASPDGKNSKLSKFAGDAREGVHGRPFGTDRDARWEESKHPRVSGGEHAGEFAPGGGAQGGGNTEGEEVDPSKFASKREAITHLLKRGTTQAEILKVTGWPSVSVPQQAAASGMKLEKFKEDGVTKYRGVAMTEEELDDARQARAEKRTAKLAVMGKTPGVRGPRGRDPQTFSLVEFLSDKGGLKPTSDLKAIYGDTNPFVPGFGRLFRKNGLSLDKAREAAVESGYFHDLGAEGSGVSTSTTRELLDAIDSENRGKRVYTLSEQRRRQGEAESQGQDPEQRRYEMESALDSALTEAGMRPDDVGGKTRDRVIEIMEHEGERDPIAAWERAVMEEDQHGEDIGEFPEREDVVPGWDVPDDLGPALAPSEGAPERGAERAGGAAREAGKGGRGKAGGKVEPTGKTPF